MNEEEAQSRVSARSRQPSAAGDRWRSATSASTFEMGNHVDALASVSPSATRGAVDGGDVRRTGRVRAVTASARSHSSRAGQHTVRVAGDALAVDGSRRAATLHARQSDVSPPPQASAQHTPSTQSPLAHTRYRSRMRRLAVRGRTSTPPRRRAGVLRERRRRGARRRVERAAEAIVDGGYRPPWAARLVSAPSSRARRHERTPSHHAERRPTTRRSPPPDDWPRSTSSGAVSSCTSFHSVPVRR